MHGVNDGLTERKELDIVIKNKLGRDRGTCPAELRSSGPKQRPDKGSDEARISEGASSNAQGSPKDIEPKPPIFVNEDAEYCAYLAKFFKGEK